MSGQERNLKVSLVKQYILIQNKVVTFRLNFLKILNTVFPRRSSWKTDVMDEHENVTDKKIVYVVNYPQQVDSTALNQTKEDSKVKNRFPAVCYK